MLLSAFATPRAPAPPRLALTPLRLWRSGCIPAGLPHGLSEHEKKLWLAIYIKARELLNIGGDATVRSAVDDAVIVVLGDRRDTTEFRFGMRWGRSVMSCLAMRQGFRSSDVYS